MKHRFIFAKAKPSHRAMIEHWVKRPHISKWLHGVGLQNTLSSLAHSFEGSSETQHWIAYYDKIPIGYLLTSEVNQNDDWVSSIEFSGEKAITLDVFIGEPDYIGKGIGPRMITDLLQSQFSDVTDVLIDPEVKNSRAVQVYQKLGFQIIKTFIASWHPAPHYLMHLKLQTEMDNVKRRNDD